MTGPENYREAEKLLASDPVCACERTDCEHGRALVTRAQVHATLALADAMGANRPPLIVAVPENLSAESAENIREAVARAMGKQS